MSGPLKVPGELGSLGERFEPGVEDSDVHFGAGHGCTRFRESDFGLHEVFLELGEFVGRDSVARCAGRRKFDGAVVHMLEPVGAGVDGLIWTVFLPAVDAAFDPAGVAIARRVMLEGGAVPWRSGGEDYYSAAKGIRFPGEPGPTPWDPAIRTEMDSEKRVVHEVVVASHLLDDLAGVPQKIKRLRFPRDAGSYEMKV